MLTVENFKSWLAQQYRAGTPLTIWYPLATAVEEDWPSSYCETPIKVATTKYTETVFNPLNTALANAVATVNTVVTQTIAQAASIATLQSGKQTRPADNAECPAYKQCLLVEDENGTPHWYEITDPFRDFVAPIIANNVAPASTTNQPGYTQLEYIESDGNSWIETNVNATNNSSVEIKFVLLNKDGFPAVFGARETMESRAFNVWGILPNGALGINIGNLGQVELEISPQIGTEYTLSMSATNLTVNGMSKSISNVSSFTTPGGVWVFNTNGANASGGGDSNRILVGKIYYVKMYNNGVLALNLIPAKRNSDSAIGMYDTVTKTFFTNAGSGTFTAGPVVANTDVPSNPTWTATWTANASNGVTAGTVYGEGLCNAVAGTANTAATSAQMSSANWSASGAECWCKVSGLTVGEEYNAAPSSISWVFRSTRSSAAGCAGNCADVCTYAVRSEASFRSAVFGM